MKNIFTLPALFGRSDYKISSQSQTSSYSLKLALEPRIVFDGAIAATAAVSEGADNVDDAQPDNEVTDSNIAIAVSENEVREIAFIDRRLPDAEVLAGNMRDNVLVVFLDPAKDGISQIGQTLSAFESIESVHILTHADSGGLYIGDTLLTSETLDQSASGLETWQDGLSSDADILFYGCDLAETAEGQEMLSKIGDLTGADISASIDLTGAQNLGGDWTLEFSTGAIESAIAVTEGGQAAYSSVMAAVPEATVTGPSIDPLLGEQVTFTVTFDNTDATDAGYAPYVNLFLPFTGADGVYNAGTDTYTSAADGLTFVSATYFETSVDSTVITLEDIDAGTPGLQFEHPVAIDTAGDPVVVTLDNALGLQEGDQIVLLQLPFGSYTPGQPAADIVVTVEVSSLADVGTGLDVITSAGFIFGDTAENDFDTDPSTQATTLNAGNTNSATITPQLYRLNTTFSGGEGETATGPNFERSYDIEVEVAAGQTLTNASLDFTFAEELVYVSTPSDGGGTIDVTNLGQAAGSDLSDDVLTIDFASLSGTQTITTNFYVSEFDQDGADVLNPLTGASRTLGETNNVGLTYDWDTTDTRDADLTGASDVSTAPTLEAKSIAVQKSVIIDTDTGSTGATPGDTLEYTINVQISDFFAYDTITVEDIFDDGQLLTGTPSLTVTRQGTGEGPYNFSTDFTDTTIAGDDHRLDFDVSGLLTTNAVSDILEGGKFGVDDLGETTFTITYQTIIQDEYDSEAGNLNVKQGDTLNNTVTVEGRLLDAALSPVVGPVLVTDGSSASVTVPNNEVSLTVYALNGSTAGTLTDIKPGDDVTFRLEYDLVTGDLEDFFLDAYLPLPVFNLNDINDDGATGENFILDNGTVIPTVGDFRYGPTATADITTGVPTPTSTIDTTSNFVRFDLGDLSDPANDGGKVDLLFTIRATDDPFADGLLLTTLSQQSDSNSPASATITNDLGQITLQQPEINQIIKGVVAVDNTGATFDNGTPSGIKAAGNTDTNPLSGTVNSTNLSGLNLDNDLSGADDGDIVRYAIVIENTGSSPNGAFDLTISDVIPAGMEVPAGGINLRVVDGAGNTIGIDTGSPDTALFAGGITLTDPGATDGALGVFDPTNGENIIIITYDLEISDSTEAATTFTETATLSNFANTEGGDDFTSVDLTDDATVTIAEVTPTKTITDTNQVHTTGNNVVVGEIVEYTVVMDIPEGLSSSTVLVDDLDAGLAFVAVDSITFLSGDITSTNGTGATILANEVTFANIGGGVDNDGRRVTIDFGDLTNVNSVNTTAETIEVVYRAIVVNTTDTNGGAALNNSATVTTTNGSETSEAVDVTVVEPIVTTTIVPSVTEADTQDTTTWTVTFTAPGNANRTPFDINFDNVIPAGLTYVGSSLTNTAGVAPDSLTENGGDFNATFGTLNPGETSTFTFQTTIDTGASIGENLEVSGTTTWESISGALGNPSPETTVDTERTGAGGINDYISVDTGSVDILFEAPTLIIDDTSETATSGSDVTIGEIVRYRFTMRIPESTTTDFRVEPDIPTGLQFIDDGTSTIAFVSDGGLSANGTGLAGNAIVAGNETTVAGIDPSFIIPGGLIAGGAFGDGDNPQFRLGDLTNTDNDSNQEFVVIEFNALILNSATNNDGVTRTADAEVLEGVTSIITSNSVDVDIVEPELTNLEKIVTGTDGTTATFQITFENASGVDAFDIDVLEALPANLGNLSNVTITPAGGVTGVTNNSTATDLDIDITDFPDGGSVTITYTADVTDNTVSVADNDVDVTWTSVDGATSSLVSSAGTTTNGTASNPDGERTGSATPALNDYAIADSAGLGIISGTLFDDVDGSNTVNVGDNLLDNVQINLTFAGDDGIFGNGDDITLSTLTDVNGDYTFGALPAGDYRVSVQPNGQPNGLGDNLDPTFDTDGSVTDNLIEITLGEGASDTGNLFGVRDIPNPPEGTDRDFTISKNETITFTATDFGFSDTDPLDTFDQVRFDTVPPVGEGVLRLSGVPVTAGQVINVTDIPNLTYIPDIDDVGAPYTDFTFSVRDNTGLFDTAPNTFEITVISQPPEGTDKTFQLEQDEVLTLTPSDFGFSDADPGDVLDNVRIDTLPANGVLSLSGVPITAGQIIPVGQIGNITFTPTAGAAGTPLATFDFSVQDQTGSFDLVPNTFTINVAPIVTPEVSTPPAPMQPLPSPPGIGSTAPPSINVNPAFLGDPNINPLTGLRVFQTDFEAFKDINFNYDISRPDFWLAGAVEQKLMIETKDMSFIVPKTIFRHSNPGESLSFEAELSDGSPLPAWLSFDSGDLSFKGTPPLDSPRALEIVIVAKDTRNEEIKAPVRVIINREVEGGELTQPELETESLESQEQPVEDQENDENAPEETNDVESEDVSFIQPSLEGRVSFSDQLYQNSRQAEIQQQQSFLDSLSG